MRGSGAPVLAPTGVCYAVFVLSGFAGLVYEATWTRYLKTVLGHEAYAQALVLGVFLGGLALGAALAGRFVSRLRAPLLGYAVAEAVLALAAVAFHDIFVATRAALELGLAPVAARWVAGTLLILPQAVLLGMTFPLLAAALVRGRGAATGRVVAWLYCSNSLGGVLGALSVGLVLVELGGLPGSMFAGALASAGAGLIAWILHHRYEPAAPQAPSLPSSRTGAGPGLLALVAAGTGLASLVYEVVWVRMLSLVLGSSTRSFELMLAAFILGLAWGGFHVRRWSDREDRLLLLAKVQLLMGVLVICGIFLYQELFHLIPVVRRELPLTETGYAAYGLAHFGIALLLMLGPTFCAGMTLPLLTRAALVRTGEQALGSIYAWNTVGAITGVALAVLVLLPQLGLKLSLLVGVVVDLSLGVLLLRLAQPARLAWGAAAAAAAVAVVLVLPPYSKYLISSGPYRQPVVDDWQDQEGNILFYRDGSTISIAVIRGPTSEKTGYASIALKSNGRGEGAQPAELRDSYGADTDDAITNLLLGSLPLLFHPGARTAAVIGFGTGYTSTVLLSSDTMQQVTTLEIESTVLEAGVLFPLSRPFFTDPRSRLLLVDAKSHFASRTGEPLDIIVSNPSHPWVSGVASLFTQEHFASMRSALAEDGVLVQWLHFYESDPEALATVLEALDQVFPNYVLFNTGLYDIAILASPDPQRLAALDAEALTKLPRLAAELSRFSLHSVAEAGALAVADRARLHPYIETFRMPPNSDYFPVLDRLAARAYYLNRTYALLQTADSYGNLFSSAALPGRRYRFPFVQLSSTSSLPRLQLTSRALALLDRAVPLRASIPTLLAESRRWDDQPALEALLAPSCGPDGESRLAATGVLALVMENATAHMYPEELAALWERLEGELPCLSLLLENERTRPVVGFYAAVAQGNQAQVIELGEALLPAEGQVDGERQAWVVLQIMLAHQAQGQPAQVLETSSRLSPNVPAHAKHGSRLLSAHALLSLQKATP